MVESNRIEITSSGGLFTIKNLDDFFESYSKPINRELMRVFKDLKLVEQLGSGLDRILSFYEKDSFIIKENFMKNVFISSIKAQDDLTDTQKKILTLLKYRNLSSAELVSELGLKTLSGSLKNAIKYLLELEYIELTIPDKPKSPKQKYKIKRVNNE